MSAHSWLDDPPKDPSRAKAYWCEIDYFLAHTATGDHPPCHCPEGQGHNDSVLYPRNRFGVDELSRYEEIDGERVAIEPYPFWWPPRCILYHPASRWGIVRWHAGVIREHGWREWWRLRAL